MSATIAKPPTAKPLVRRKAESAPYSRAAIEQALPRLVNRPKLSVSDFELLFYLRDHCAVPYDLWPRELKTAARERQLEVLRDEGYISRKYEPLRYGLTRVGLGMIESLEQTMQVIGKR
jgi:hypothetical protein